MRVRPGAGVVGRSRRESDCRPAQHTCPLDVQPIAQIGSNLRSNRSDFGTAVRERALSGLRAVGTAVA